MEEILNNLNPRQKEAVTIINGPLLILAGPGSGKTRVLTHRLANLVANNIAPENILAVTFTNKAADEMKQRIAKIIGKKFYTPLIGTFHSVCLRILKKEIDKLVEELLKFAIKSLKESESTYILVKPDRNHSLLYKYLNGLDLQRNAPYTDWGCDFLKMS